MSRVCGEGYGRPLLRRLRASKMKAFEDILFGAPLPPYKPHTPEDIKGGGNMYYKPATMFLYIKLPLYKSVVSTTQCPNRSSFLLF